VCYVGVTIAGGEGAILRENMCPISLTPLGLEAYLGPGHIMLDQDPAPHAKEAQ